MDEFLKSLSGAELHVVRSGGVLAGAKGFLQRELQQFASSAAVPVAGMLLIMCYAFACAIQHALTALCVVFSAETKQPVSVQNPGAGAASAPRDDAPASSSAAQLPGAKRCTVN
jgi:hypothetical protein